MGRGLFRVLLGVESGGESSGFFIFLFVPFVFAPLRADTQSSESITFWVGLWHFMTFQW